MSYRQYNFLAKVAQEMIQQFGSDFRRVAVVFNNQRPIQYLNAHLAAELKQVFWSPRYFTIQEFIRASSPYSEMHPTAQAFSLSQLYVQLQKEKYPDYEEDPVKLFPLAELILADFAQLDYELVDVDKIFHHLEDLSTLDSHFDYLSDEQKEYLQRFWSSFSQNSVGELQQKFLAIWRLLPKLYTLFKQQCKSQNTSTMAGMYRDFAENAPDVLDPLAQVDYVLFVGFNALNACEKIMFKRLQSQGKALFYFDVDAHYYENSIQEAGYFFRENFGNIGLKNALGDPIRHIQDLKLEVEVVQSPGQVAQAKLLHPIITSEWLNRPGSKAIILADESLLIPVMQSLPEAKYNITMGFPIHESLSYGLFHVFVEAQWHLQKQGRKVRKGIPHGLLMEIAGHPMNGLDTTERATLLESLSKVDKAEVPLAQVEDLFGVGRSAGTSLIMDFWKVSESGKDLFKRIERLWEHTFAQNQLDETQDNLEKSLAENALRAMQGMQQMLDQFPDMGVSMTIRLLKKITAPITATLTGDPFQGVQIMGILESRSLNFDHILLVGANEGFLPTLKSAPSLLPYHIRRAFGLPVLEHQNGLSAYLFYRLFHNQPSFYILYNSLVSENSSGELSRFVRQMEFETQVQFNFRQVHFDLDANSKDEKPIEQPLTTIQKTDAIWEKLENFLDGDRRSLSATAFTTYLQSPLLFFFKYISGIKEPPVLQKGLEKNVLGTLVHKIMEICYEPFRVKQQIVHRADVERLISRLDALAEQAFLEEFRTNAEEAQEEMTIAIAKRFARQYLVFDRDFAAPFSILELENKEDYIWELPIHVKGESRRIRLRGIIDRIDRLESIEGKRAAGQIRIVDYKTGRDDLLVKMPAVSAQDAAASYFDNFGKDSDQSPDNKAFVQTLFYTFIYEKVSDKTFVEPNLYTYSPLKKGQSLFALKPSRAAEIPVEGPTLSMIKEGFQKYLVQKLEELFNQDIPFIHPVDVEFYSTDPYRVFFDGFEGEAEVEST